MGGAVTFNLRFPGQYADAETGLHHNYFRDYDASLGRYIQSDPIGLVAGLNTYGYGSGNPVRYIDPYGLVPCSPDNRAKCEEFCRSSNSEVLVCEQDTYNLLVVDLTRHSCTCTNDEKWGGYREGKPDIPENCTKVDREVRNVKSQDFKDFLDEHDISKKGWKKVMEKYETPYGEIIKRHWWEGPGGQSFHHL